MLESPRQTKISNINIPGQPGSQENIGDYTENVYTDIQSLENILYMSPTVRGNMQLNMYTFFIQQY